MQLRFYEVWISRCEVATTKARRPVEALCVSAGKLIAYLTACHIFFFKVRDHRPQKKDRRGGKGRHRQQTSPIERLLIPGAGELLLWLLTQSKKSSTRKENKALGSITHTSFLLACYCITTFLERKTEKLLLKFKESIVSRIRIQIRTLLSPNWTCVYLDRYVFTKAAYFSISVALSGRQERWWLDMEEGPYHASKMAAS